MTVRGRRECLSCGRHWSYFETRAVDCPDCGSIRSRADDDEPALHTAGGADLDLTAARAAVDDRPLREVADLAGDAARSFLADRGFIHGGTLQPLDEVTVAVAVLRAVADRVGRTLTPDGDAEWYLLGLLSGVDEGKQPAEVPEAFRPARGRAIATAVERYRNDLLRYLDAQPDPVARQHLGRLRDHLRRIEALEGDVPTETVDAVLVAARALGDHLRGDPNAMRRVETVLAQL